MHAVGLTRLEVKLDIGLTSVTPNWAVPNRWAGIRPDSRNSFIAVTSPIWQPLAPRRFHTKVDDIELTPLTAAQSQMTIFYRPEESVGKTSAR